MNDTLGMVATATPGGCRLEIAGVAPTLVGWRWLREHDESEAGLDPVTGQRRLDLARGSASVVALDVHGSELRVSWTDGHHSRHLASTLAAAIRDRRRMPAARTAPLRLPTGPEPWPAPPENPPDPIEFGAFVTDDEARLELLRRMRRWGWAQASGVPDGSGAIEEFASRIGYVRATIFGGVWELAADLTEHADTAYSSGALAPHTDGTYSHDGPGVQLFGCQQKRGTGGESILADGFAAAADLTRTDPGGAGLLVALDVPCRYVEPGVSLRAERPVLRCDQADRLVQVSVNPYDRAPFLLDDPDGWERFASAYDAYLSLVDDPDRWLRLEWEPGLLLVFDNWRLLHGRGSFTGSRRFLGCYVNHEDLESAWRVNHID